MSHTHTHAHRHAHRRCRGLALLPGASSLHTQIWENRKMGKCGGGVKTLVGHCGNVLLLTVICSLCFHSFSSLASNNPMWVWLSPVNLPTLFFFILFLPLMSLCPPSGFYFYHTFLSFHLAPLSRCLSHPADFIVVPGGDWQNKQRHWGTEGLIQPWRAGRFRVLWLVTEDTLIRVEVPGFGSQDLHYVPEEVYRRPGAQGHHWDLSPRGEGSAWAEEARKFTGTGLQLVKGEPQEKVHH